MLITYTADYMTSPPGQWLDQPRPLPVLELNKAKLWSRRTNANSPGKMLIIFVISKSKLIDPARSGLEVPRWCWDGLLLLVSGCEERRESVHQFVKRGRLPFNGHQSPLHISNEKSSRRKMSSAHCNSDRPPLPPLAPLNKSWALGPYAVVP